MLELIRKNTLLTDAFSIETDTDVDNAMSVISINPVEGNAEKGFTETTGITLSLDREQIDEMIFILHEASNALKRSENI
ncbi:hypothetical protein ACIQXI_00560 [Lysinibacillus sp. NPDC097195]|uniref:hypothetical protein n=1 Tax=Lysinibacillus sp. NPDC097195 TaxID=3364141 RepID=UPI003826B4F9